jgi:hypothetical protein
MTTTKLPSNYQTYFGRVEVAANSDYYPKLSIVDNFSSKRVTIVIRPKAACGIEVGATIGEVYFSFQQSNSTYPLLYSYVHSEEVSLAATGWHYVPTGFQALYIIERAVSGPGWEWSRASDADLTTVSQQQEQEGGNVSTRWSHWEEWTRPTPSPPLPIQSGVERSTRLVCTHSSAFIVRTLVEGSSVLEWWVLSPSAFHCAVFYDYWWISVSTGAHRDESASTRRSDPT